MALQLCEYEDITGIECDETDLLTLSYNGIPRDLCQKHFDIVLLYADTKDNDEQLELEYQKERLFDILSRWSTPYPGEHLAHWKMVQDKINELIKVAKDDSH